MKKIKVRKQKIQRRKAERKRGGEGHPSGMIYAAAMKRKREGPMMESC